MRFLGLMTLLLAARLVFAAEPLRIAVAGLVHGHVEGFLLRPAKARADVQIVGIYEPNRDLQRKYGQKYGFPDSIFFTDLDLMLARQHPDAVATFTNTFDHAMVVEACAKHRITVMMEKPLAVSVEHATRIQQAAERAHIQVIVNYETTWYPSSRAIGDLVANRSLGAVRRMAAMDGHQGPKEIHVGPEFLEWLTNPKLNGAGALFDFGCYGADLMTWLMQNERPVAVTAVTKRIKPDIYTAVDDDSTIIVEYPKAQGIIEGSWNWPFGRKDLEVYGETGYATATGGDSLKVRLNLGKEQNQEMRPMPEDEHDALSYLVAVARGRTVSSGLSSLQTNLIATEILDAARRSAETGRRVVLSANRKPLSVVR